MFRVGRPESVHKRIWSTVGSEPWFGNAFSKFGKEREVRDRAIVKRVIFVHLGLFKKRCDYGMIKGWWNVASGKRHTDDSGDGWKQDRQAFLEQPCMIGSRSHCLFVTDLLYWGFQRLRWKLERRNLVDEEVVAVGADWRFWVARNKAKLVDFLREEGCKWVRQGRGD